MKASERKHEVSKQKGINVKRRKKKIYIKRNSQFMLLPENVNVTKETDRQEMQQAVVNEKI